MAKQWNIFARLNCRPSVIDRPRSRAESMSTALCRIKWMSVAGIAMVGLGLVAMVTDARVMSLMPGYPWPLLVTHVLPILAMFGFMLLTTKALSIRKAQGYMLIFASIVIGCSAFLAGVMQLSPFFVPAYCIVLFVMFICVTLPPWTMAVLLVMSLAVAYGVALWAGVASETGWMFKLNEASHETAIEYSPGAMRLSAACMLLPPIFTGVFAIVMNAWAQRKTRASQLARKTIERQTKWLALRKQENERLLDRVLTASVARRIRETGSFPPSTRDLCVVVCDVVGFTDYCQRIPAQMIVAELYRFFSVFDECCTRYGIEPLRSQGDCRLAVGGLAEAEGQAQQEENHLAAVDALLAMLAFRSLLRPVDMPDGAASEEQPLFQARIGIHSGPVLMGVMDGVRMSFDVWGDTVNRAARLQQGAGVNRILVSEQVLWACRGLFEHGAIEAVHVKNLQVPAAAEILGIKAEYQDAQGEPNEAFWRIYHAKCITVPPPKNGDAPASLRIPMK